ncbi:MAG TPA: hypothetical protein VMH01_07390 [Puia sp.]|nr:hypothetical protein [Puia sp.]
MESKVKKNKTRIIAYYTVTILALVYFVISVHSRTSSGASNQDFSFLDFLTQ